MKVTWHHAQQDNFSVVADRVERCGPVWVFDTSFDYKTDTLLKTRPDADTDSQRLPLVHVLLWTFTLLRSGVDFAPGVSSAGRNDYLIHADVANVRYCYDIYTITTSCIRWLRRKSLVDDIAGQNEVQRSHYINVNTASAVQWFGLSGRSTH